MSDKKKPIKKGLAAPPDRAVVKKTKGSAKAKRTSARLAAVQVLYQMQLNNQDATAALKDFIDHRIGFNLDGDVFVPADEDLLTAIVRGVEERWADIDAVVTAALAAGKKEKVETLLDAVLRAGAYELLADTRTDSGIIINDYMNVVVGFYEGAEPKLVNAILDKIAKTVRT